MSKEETEVPSEIPGEVCVWQGTATAKDLGEDAGSTCSKANEKASGAEG